MSDSRCMATGEVISWDACLDCALAGAPCGWSYGLLRKVRAHQARTRDGIHVSDLKSCLLKAYWHRTKPPVPAFPSESMYVLLGTMTHSLLEGADHNLWTEVPVLMLVNGEWLYGTVDGYETGLKRVIDYKTTRYLDKTKVPYSEHADQVRIYAIMLRSMGLEVNAAQVQYIDLTGPSKCKSCKGKLIPAQEMFICQRCGREYGTDAVHTGAHTCDIELGDLDSLQKEIEERIATLATALATNTAPEGEPGWLCDYCPFKGECSYAS